MSLSDKINEEIKKAMMAKDADRLSTLRFLKSALKYVAIEKKTETLADPDIHQVIQKQIKQRREAIEQFQKAGRAEMAAKETQEIMVLESFLPAQLSDAELDRKITDAIAAEGAVSKKDFGRVMKVLTVQLAGRAEAKKISERLSSKLT